MPSAAGAEFESVRTARETYPVEAEVFLGRVEALGLATDVQWTCDACKDVFAFEDVGIILTGMNAGFPICPGPDCVEAGWVAIHPATSRA